MIEGDLRIGSKLEDCLTERSFLEMIDLMSLHVSGCVEGLLISEKVPAPSDS